MEKNLKNTILKIISINAIIYSIVNVAYKY